MFTISAFTSSLISCRKHILRGKSGHVVHPSQLNKNWFVPEKKIEINNCANPIEEHQNIISSIGVSSTPSIFLPNGKLIQGYMSPEEVIKKIEN